MLIFFNYFKIKNAQENKSMYAYIVKSQAADLLEILVAKMFGTGTD